MDVAPMLPMAEKLSKQAVRLAAVGDLHVKKTSQGQLQPLLAPVNDHADVLLLCGDLTDYGLKEEALILAKVLDGEAVEIRGVGIAGAKGFSGGFGRATLGAWGEPATKRFVQEALNEAIKFEGALARLRTTRRV